MTLKVSTATGTVWAVACLPYQSNFIVRTRNSLDCNRSNVYSTHVNRRYHKLSYYYNYNYKKFELMLTRCAKAYSSTCLQVILVYLHPFRHNSLFCSQNHLKSIFLGFKVIQDHRCWHS